MDWYFGDVALVRVLFQRALTRIYLIAFLVVLNQFKPLLGERGFLPVPEFLKHVWFRQAPASFTGAIPIASSMSWRGPVSFFPPQR